MVHLCLAWCTCAQHLVRMEVYLWRVPPSGSVWGVLPHTVLGATSFWKWHIPFSGASQCAKGRRAHCAACAHENLLVGPDHDRPHLHSRFEVNIRGSVTVTSTAHVAVIAPIKQNCVRLALSSLARCTAYFWGDLILIEE